MVLEANEVHLWNIDDTVTTDHKELNFFANTLSKTEHEKMERFRFTKHRHQYLVAHGALRNILSFYISTVKPHEWLFDTNQFGKPSISNSGVIKNLIFNLSHTEGQIAIVVSNGIQCGVDIENNQHDLKNTNLVAHIFSKSEYDDYIKLAPNQRTSRIFSIWTLKESFVKAVGKGLTIPLENISFDLSNAISISFKANLAYSFSSKQWNFIHLNHKKKYSISVAALSDTKQRNLKLVLVPYEISVHKKGPYQVVASSTNISIVTYGH